MDEKNLENKNDLFGFASFDKYESEHIAAPQYSYWKSVWRTFVKNKFTVAVAILMLVLVLFALIQHEHIVIQMHAQSGASNLTPKKLGPKEIIENKDTPFDRLRAQVRKSVENGG